MRGAISRGDFVDFDRRKKMRAISGYKKHEKYIKMYQTIAIDQIVNNLTRCDSKTKATAI